LASVSDFLSHKIAAQSALTMRSLARHRLKAPNERHLYIHTTERAYRYRYRNRMQRVGCELVAADLAMVSEQEEMRHTDGRWLSLFKGGCKCIRIIFFFYGKNLRQSYRTENYFLTALYNQVRTTCKHILI